MRMHRANLRGILLACTLLLAAFSFAGAQADNPLFVVTVKDKQGYIDRSGRIAIEPIFEQARDFSEGLAVAALGQKYGFIDTTGKMVIEPRFERVLSFSDGMAMFWEGYLAGFIDSTGKVVVKPQFTNARNFTDGLAAVEIVRPEGIVHPLSKTRFPSLWGYIDKTGRIVLEPQFIYGYPFNKGRAKHWTGPFVSLDKYAYIDKYGKEIFAPVFDNVSEEFSDELATARRNSRWVIINEAGKQVADASFDAAGDFAEGLAAVGVKNKYGEVIWGYADRTGKVVIEPRFAKAQQFSDGRAVVSIFAKNGWKPVVIDTTGRIVFKLPGTTNETYKNGLLRFYVKSGKSIIGPHGEKLNVVKIGYLDKDGNYVWKPSGGVVF